MLSIFQCVVVVLLTVAGALFSSAVLAIKDGYEDGAGNDKKIFMPLTNGQTKATAFNVKYPRCLLTAAHVDQITHVYAGTDLRDLAGRKRQPVTALVKRPGWRPLWTDLQILWLSNLQTALSIREPGDYQAVNLQDSITLPTLGVLAGYGHNTTQAGVDVGSGIRRWGRANTQLFESGVARNPPRAGSYYFLPASVFPLHNASCGADSGGPAASDILLTNVFGVTTANVGQDCAGSTDTIVTGLDRGAPAGEKSNWDWVHETIEKICTKKVGVDIWPMPSSGEVVGVLNPAPSFYDGLEMNGVINTTQGDWEENVHDGQTLTLTAIPNQPWWRFKWWTSLRLMHCTPQGCELGRSYCHACEGSTNPVCVLPYSLVGYDDEQESYDWSRCIAEFESEDKGCDSSPCE